MYHLSTISLAQSADRHNAVSDVERNVCGLTEDNSLHRLRKVTKMGP
jgi:hypothetical protein